MKYFDLITIKIYKQYIKWNEKDIPEIYAILILSFFQVFNILFLVFLLKRISNNDEWSFSKINILIIAFSVLLFNYIRMIKIIGFNKIVAKYKDQHDKFLFSPILYFFISMGLMLLLKLLGMFPHIT